VRAFGSKELLSFDPLRCHEGSPFSYQYLFSAPKWVIEKVRSFEILRVHNIVLERGRYMAPETTDRDTTDWGEGLSPLLASIVKTCGKRLEIDPNDIQKTAALILATSLGYYADIQKHAKQSFRWALGFAAMGTLFLVASSTFFMLTKANLANISLIGGGLIQFIAAVNFYLYRQTSKQFAGFHICLERMDRYLLANSFCEKLTGEKDQCRRNMIEIMANAPMLTLEQLGVSVKGRVVKDERAASASAGR
jgi:TRADD-N domain-containing protein